MYPESCDCGLPDHSPVDWSRGLTSLDWPRGLAGSRGWFRCLSPWNHMTIESDLSPRVQRSGHELFPRMNWKWERLNMRRILIPTSVIFVLKGTDDKTLQLVQITASCRLSLYGLVYWCICASLGLEELIVAIQRSTRRNDDVGVTWNRRNFNVMVVITLLIITLLFLLCYVSLHYTKGKVNVYLPSAVGMVVWYSSDISFKRCLSLHLKYHSLGFFLNKKKKKKLLWILWLLVNEFVCWSIIQRWRHITMTIYLSVLMDFTVFY